MNIQMQCSSLVIMFFLIFFLKRQKTLGLHSEKLFFKNLIVSIICVTLDILSIIAITYLNESFPIVVEIICKTYIVSLFWVGLLSFAYASTDLYYYDKTSIFYRIYAVAAVIGTVLIYVVPIKYYHEGYEIYTYGPSTLVAYIFTFTMLIGTVFIVNHYKSKINPKRLETVRIWVVVWIVALLIQYFSSSILLAGFAAGINMMILFFKLENPDANLDRVTGAFNMHAMLEYMRQKYNENKHFAGMLISFNIYQNTNASINCLDIVIKEMINYLGSWKNIKVFKSVEREIIVIADDENVISDVLSNIQKKFKNCGARNVGNNKESYFNPYYIILKNNDIANNAEDVYALFKYFKANIDNFFEQRVFYVTKEIVEKKYENESIKAAVISAIKEDRVDIFLQPIYNVKAEKFTAAEALVRIWGKNGEIMSPGKFIPIAESSGLIVQLGEIVFEKVCRLIKDNNLNELGLEYIEVNLSVRQCEKSNLAENYIGIMERYNVNPHCINLEITETASIHTKNILMKNMERLIEYGIKFSLDDFGNGESNLNYIVDMPVSFVKFDKDMSNAYFQNGKAKFVMEAAMQMIHDLQLEIVSEGIETKEQVDKITELGIEYIQGYYFSKPLPQSNFIQFIREKNEITERKY